VTAAVLQYSLAQQVLKAIRKLTGDGPASLHEPQLSGNEWTYLKECLDSTFVSSVGKFVDRFEDELAAYTGAHHVIAVVNGTAALHVALKLAGVQANDEVLIPAMTFVATANAVSYCNAIPHFVDSEEDTLGIDAEKLREYLSQVTELRNGQCINSKTGRVIRVLLPMHTFGHPVDVDGLLAIANDFHLVLIEDAAESLGSFYHGVHTGTFGLMGTLSFNGNKTLTTGGGGAILTNDPVLAKQVKHITTTAKLRHRWNYEHDQIGYNYRMPNLNAALGCAQLEQLPVFLNAKRDIFKRYEEAFRNVDCVNLFSEPVGCQSNYWLQTLVLDSNVAEQRDEILETTNDAGVMTRPVWTLMTKMKQFASCPSMALNTSTSLEKRIINLPSSSRLSVRTA
jgi:aminotransferase in exopolysaccharide biosynthesis